MKPARLESTIWAEPGTKMAGRCCHSPRNRFIPSESNPPADGAGACPVLHDKPVLYNYRSSIIVVHGVIAAEGAIAHLRSDIMAVTVKNPS